MKPVGDMEEELEVPLLTDDSHMPFGKYKGYQMEDVPAGYLLWLADDSDYPSPVIVKYVNSKRKQLQQEVDEDRDDDEDGGY